MLSKLKIIALTLVFLGLFFLLYLVTRHSNFQLLNSQGMIAIKERNLMLITASMGLGVVIPVIFITYFIAWKYRETNTNAPYTPDKVTTPFWQIVWWSIPTTIIGIVAVIMWFSTHELDPHKPIMTNTPPLRVQVVSLRWKWLFIYPDQQIASVNYLAIPEKTPIAFELTSDAPMNSFWIPQLNGQIYSMTGMRTTTHLIADQVGNYTGRAAEISGPGFADMTFVVRSTTQNDFDHWVQTVKQSAKTLDMHTYDQLARPSEQVPESFYASVEPDLYNTIIMKFMLPSGDPSETMAEDMEM